MNRLLVIALVVVLMAGCSSGNNPVTPADAPGSPVEETALTNQDHSVQGGRVLWGLYDCIVDLQQETVEVIPLREALSHYNVVTDMNTHPPRVVFDGLSVDKPENKISLDVFLYHPYPHKPNLAGFDVHGIMIGPGSVDCFSDPTLVIAGPEDPHIMNPDGWTRWWNPVEFNIGDDIFSYTDGNRGIPHSIGNYNATLNAFKTFSGDLGIVEDIGELNLPDRLIFTTDAVHSRHYDVWFPMEDNHFIFRYNYAIDASWEPIPGFVPGSPVNAPEDWESNANQEEPFWVTVDTMYNGLYYEDNSIKGGEATLEVKVFDWQGYLDGGNVSDEIVSVQYECPQAYSTPVMGTLKDPGPGSMAYATYEIELTGDNLLTNMDCTMLLTVESANGDYQPGTSGYSGTAPLSYYRILPHPPILVQAPPLNEPPVAHATMDAGAEIEIDTLVTFDASGSTDEDGEIVLYEWDFDNDGTYGDEYDYGTLLLPEVMFDTPGEYWIDLKVTDDDGAADNLDEKLHIIVNPPPNIPPVAIATSNKTDLMVGEEVTFDGTFSYDLDGTIDSYSWDFDNDGVYGDPYDSGTDEMPVVSFSTAGEHMVDLCVMDNDGDNDYLDEKLIIMVTDPDNLPPVAAAMADKYTVDIGETVTFDGTLSSDPDGVIAAYDWDFDNDSIFGDAYDGGTDEMPEISFATSGYHFVNLRVTDDDGGIDSLDEKLVIMVNEPENQPPVAIAEALTYTCYPGDLIVLDATGSYDPDGVIVLYEWDFDGDGSFGDSYLSGSDDMPEIMMSMVGTYCFDLRVWDDDGAWDTLNEEICIEVIDFPNEPPVANAFPDGEMGYTGEPFCFDATGSYDSDGIIVSWEWDFNDDGIYGDPYDSGTDEQPCVIFEEPGMYCVDLRVTDDDGATDTLDELICVDITIEPNEPPVAIAHTELYTVYAGDLVIFDATGSYDPDGMIVLYEWDFDYDGVYGDPYDTGSDDMPGIYLHDTGYYCFDLKVWDDDSAWDVLDTAICITVIEVPNEPPVAVAYSDEYSGYVGDTFHLHGGDSYDTDGFIVSYEWDFNEDGVYGDPYDGGTDMDPELVFDEPGEYSIDLMVTDDDGATDTLGEPFCLLVEEIPNEPPVAVGELLSTVLFDSLPLEFTAEGSYDPDGFITDWLWDFNNDGVFGDPYDMGTDDHPFVYLAAGTHMVNLKVIDNMGAEDTLDILIEFYVHDGVVITLEEDQWYKTTPGWEYVALNALTPGMLPIDTMDTDGPWDFTTVAYTDIPDTFSTIPITDPEVSMYFPDPYPLSTDHCVKYDLVGSQFYGSMYLPEEADYGLNTLTIHGFFGENLLSGLIDVFQCNSDTGGEAIIHFPLTTSMDEEYWHYYPDMIDDTQQTYYHEWGVGEGLFDVPYTGFLDGAALMTRAIWRYYTLADLVMEVMIIKWTDDTGVEVARLYTVNDPDGINFNPDTFMITGASRLLVLADD